MPIISKKTDPFYSDVIFPPVSYADEEGLLAVGGNLSPGALLKAYRSGIFPWSVNPITWWSPDPRGIIELDSFHVPRSLERLINSGKFQITFDKAFNKVMQGCAKSRFGREETWISPEFIVAYIKLFQLKFAHSVECWYENKLAGGVYGVHIGGFFAGESMFYEVTDAGKVALISLLRHLKKNDFQLFDTQQVTQVTLRFGAIEIPRDEYLARLEKAIVANCQF
ncbi:MAG: leucyl/phenylalanyl-tRNA--protein transferase [Candidatus Riflebacteria bacterium]|nr:leucyl/phenylalanyl-tRNA--protein transferase [Candidatus Riflebacteria bacterium]